MREHEVTVAEKVQQTMTIAQIAELCGAGIQTIRDWVEKLKTESGFINTDSDGVDPNFGSIIQKLEKASPKYPAQFTLQETITIIRARGNTTVADLLQTNLVLEEQLAQAQQNIQAMYAEVVPMMQWGYLFRESAHTQLSMSMMTNLIRLASQPDLRVKEIAKLSGLTESVARRLVGVIRSIYKISTPEGLLKAWRKRQWQVYKNQRLFSSYGERYFDPAVKLLKESLDGDDKDGDA